MDEIRCPKCGELNPAEAEVCGFCQERLKPLPGWLDSLRQDGQDWLSSLHGSSREEDPLEEATPASEAAPPAAGEGASSAAEPEPEWLREIQARQNLGGVNSEDRSGSIPDPASSQDPGSLEQAQAPLESVPPFVLDEEMHDMSDLPGWLANLPGGDEPEEGPVDPIMPDVSESDFDLAPAELPNWLEAMRPIEAAAAGHPEKDETDRSIESSGPLSGLRGVLPAEPEIAQVKKPAAYSARLHVSESDGPHVSTLAELVRTEGQARPLPSRPSISPQAILRFVIFFVLLVGIAWPVYTGSQAVPLPPLPAEVENTSLLIDGLSSSAPVLLAVDYQPGLSPEMDAAAGAVVDHLMLKRAYLTLVTTTFTGTAQAERLIRMVDSRGGHQYGGADQYANLGFVPGGAAGLLSFAETPRRTLPYTQEGFFAWTAAPLQVVERIGDFALVLVITENPDTARAWIEQVQPQLGAAPLVMVVSQQAEPVVRPYYEGSPQQVRGLVAGLAGGAAYENLHARMGLARKYWDSFSTALLLAAGLILIGGAANLVYSMLSNRKMAGREGQG